MRVLPVALCANRENICKHPIKYRYKISIVTTAITTIVVIAVVFVVPIAVMLLHICIQ